MLNCSRKNNIKTPNINVWYFQQILFKIYSLQNLNTLNVCPCTITSHEQIGLNEKLKSFYFVYCIPNILLVIYFELILCIIIENRLGAEFHTLFSAQSKQ